MVSTFLGAADFQPDDRPIIESAMGLWATLLSGSKETSQAVALESGFLALGLLKCRDAKVRECFKNTLASICKDH